MANVSITTRCNRFCACCFATEALQPSVTPIEHMTLETFERTLDFLARSNMGCVRLLGGEPTLHPEFSRLVDRVRDRGFDLMVFSGGLMPSGPLATLESMPPEAVTILVNAIPPRAADSSLRRQSEVLRRLGPRVLLGATIESPAVQLGHLLEWIERNGLRRAVRLGLAHPVYEGTNTFLHPRHYRTVGCRVIEFARRARDCDVRIEFDCGFVPCMFPPEALRNLGIAEDSIGARCNPVLDVLPSGRVISCYPLARHGIEPLSDERDAGWFRARFAACQATARTFTLFKACATCDFRTRGACEGGCLAGSLRRLRTADFVLSVPPAQGAL